MLNSGAIGGVYKNKILSKLIPVSILVIFQNINQAVARCFVSARRE